MIVFLLILAIIVLYYYCNHKFLETFEDTSVNLDDIVNDPDKTSNFIDEKIGNVYKKNVDLNYYKNLNRVSETGHVLDKIVSNLSKKDIDKLSNIFTNEVAPILGKLQKKIKIGDIKIPTNRIPDKCSTKDNYILPELDLDKIQNMKLKKFSKLKPKKNKIYEHNHEHGHDEHHDHEHFKNYSRF